MRSPMLALLAFLAAFGGLGDRPGSWVSQAQAAGKVDRTHAGTIAPAATFTDRANTPHRLAAFAGRPVLVNLWATWCAPCLAEMPALDRLRARSGGGLNVLAISQDLGGWRAVDKFFKPGRFKSLTPYLDQENALALGYKAAGLPLSILYDARGREVWRVAGPLEWDRLDPARLR